MLGRAATVVLRNVVARFDEDVVVTEAGLEIGGEVFELADILEVNPLEGRHHGKQISGV
jgi:hypothetical protein